MKRGTIRALVASLAVVVAVSCGVVLGGCSSANPEQAIRDDLTATLDEVKNVDDATIEELMGSVDTSQLEPYGIDGTEFARSLLDGFDYSIGDITVDGDTATAQVSITCKSAMDLYDELENMMTELSEDPDNPEPALRRGGLQRPARRAFDGGHGLARAVHQGPRAHLHQRRRHLDHGQQLRRRARADIRHRVGRAPSVARGGYPSTSPAMRAVSVASRA